MMMKFELKAVCLLFSFILLQNYLCLSAQSEYSNELPEHPRLLVTNSDIQEYESKLRINPLLKKLHNAIINSADKIIDHKPHEYLKRGKRLLGVSRAYLKRLFYLGYAYRITGEIKYADKAEQEMLTASRFSDWNPSHFLDVAEMTMAMAIGYDWTFNELREDSKEKIKSAILQKGIMPSKDEDHDGWLNDTHNWNQVCNAGITFGAIAVYEDYPEIASGIIERSKRSIRIAQNDYEPDGVYAEGPSYWNYGTTFNSLFIEAVSKLPATHNDLSISPGFMKTGHYFLHVHGPVGSFNYFDGRQNFALTPAIFWFAKELKDPDLLYHQIPLLTKMDKLNAVDSDNRIFPMIPIWLSQLDTLTNKGSSDLSWTGHGSNPVSMHRTSWNEDAIFIGVKGGCPGLNHGHMDAGSFVMDALGIRWAKDLGMHPYYELEKEGFDLWNMNQDSQRWTLFRYNNFSHNTLVVNNSLQRVNGNCPIIKIIDVKQRKGAVVDLTEVYDKYLNKVKRTLTINDGEYVNVTDVIENGNSLSEIRWGFVTLDSIYAIIDNKAVIKNDDKALLVVVKNPRSAKLKRVPTKPNYSFENDNPGTVFLGFEIELKPDSKTILKIDLTPVEFEDIMDEI